MSNKHNTMQLLRHQNVMILDAAEFKADIINLLSCKDENNMDELIMSALLLGVIYGKRLERQRKRKQQ